jgi:hypothetical protein
MQFKKEFGEELLHHEKHDNSPLSIQEMQELFDKLAPLLEMGSPECRKLIDKLDHLPGSETLVQQIDDLDFEKAIVTFTEIRKMLEGK